MSLTKALTPLTKTPLRFLSAGETVAPAQGEHPTRVMDSHELFFVTRGQLALFEEDQSFEVNAGEALLLVRGRRHGPLRAYAKGLRFYWLHFMQRDGSEFPDARLSSVRQHTTVMRPERARILFQGILEDQDAGRLTQLTADLSALQIILEIADRRPTPESATGSAALAAQADRFIRQYAYRAIGSSEIAEALRCNPDYLGRVFRRTFGKTLTDAIHERRAYEACQLLQRSELNVNEVAHACGWENLGHFRKVFTRHVGMAPSAYRQRYAGRRIGRRGPPATRVSEYTIPAFGDSIGAKRSGL